MKELQLALTSQVWALNTNTHQGSRAARRLSRSDAGRGGAGRARDVMVVPPIGKRAEQCKWQQYDSKFTSKQLAIYESRKSSLKKNALAIIDLRKKD